MTYDITRKRVSETADIELTDGDGAAMFDDDGTRLTVTICGPGSKTWQQADAERNRRQASLVEKNPKKWGSAFADKRRDEEIEFLVAITVSFNGWTYPHPDGGVWPTNRDMYRAAYADNSIGYIRDQLLKEGNDWEAFSKAGAKTLSSTSANLPG